MFKTVKRTWGYYKVLFHIPFFKVKYLHFYPDSELSMQRHQFRSELWFIFGKKCKSYLNGNIQENTKVLFVPKCNLHSFKAIDPINVIEIQFGSRVDENDIERYAFGWWGKIN